MYEMTLKDRSVWRLDSNGGVLYDGSRGMPFAAPHDSWRVIGFTRRHHSHDLITLVQAARGADLGQGWVHDEDHGTHRMWGMPSSRRVVRVVKVS